MVAVAEVSTNVAVRQVFAAITVRLAAEFHSAVRVPDRVAMGHAVQKTHVYVILDGLEDYAIKKCHTKENKNLHCHRHHRHHGQHMVTIIKQYHQGIQQNLDDIVHYCENEHNIKKK